MQLLFWIIFLLAFTYPLFLFWVYQQWSKISSRNDLLQPADLPEISVIVPARNESQTINACLKSLTNQSYPKDKLEILVVDDFSTDDTTSKVASWENRGVKLIKLSVFLEEGQIIAFKKRAIETAIKQANGQFIITTDADCIAPPNWLKLLGSYLIKENLKALAAPVNFFQEQNALARFQSLDYIGMMGLTGAGIHSGAFFLCNGANFAYDRAAFWEVGGFDGIDQVASGDDLLLFYKFAQRFPGNIKFLKNGAATVLTYPKPSWKAFLNQRIRWASKSKAYKDKGLLFTQVFVFLYCLTIVVLGLSSVFWPAGLALFALFFLLKTAADYWYLKLLCDFFQRPDLLKHFLWSQLLHLSYLILIGISSSFTKKYKWKERWMQ